MITAENFNTLSVGHLPAHLGIAMLDVSSAGVRAEMTLSDNLRAPNGFLHAGAVVTLADSCCGCGCMALRPDGATGFTTIELKSNFLGTARDGTVQCSATPVHLGRNTQVWDATVTHQGKTIALFRCTQMLLYPKPAA